MTLTGTSGGTFSSTAGLSINAGTGEVNLATSTPAAYTVTYSFASGGCSNTTTASVTINVLPTATISYAGSPYCATGTASVTLTGTSGGTFSSTAGLNINASTGEINLVTSTPATYTVTYAVTDGNGCSNSTTTSVTINALPLVSVPIDETICTTPSIAVSGLLNGGSSISGSATQGQWTWSAIPATTVTLSNTGFVSDPNSVTTTLIAGYEGDVTFTLTSNDPLGCGAASASFTATIIGAQAATTWTGTVDANWHNSANWTNCVPGPTTVTTIAATANNPRITAADGDCFNIDIQNGAQLEITGSLQLNVYE